MLVLSQAKQDDKRNVYLYVCNYITKPNKCEKPFLYAHRLKRGCNIGVNVFMRLRGAGFRYLSYFGGMECVIVYDNPHSLNSSYPN